MKKIIAIVAGDPDSINSEIIAKTWKNKKLFKNLNIFVIGNFQLIKKQLEVLKIKIKLNKISSLKSNNFKNGLSILDVPFSFKKPFDLKKKIKKNYVIETLNIAIKLSKEKKIIGFVNCPINKTEIFDKNLGVTEFLGKKFKTKGKEAMLIYNKQLSVCPITTHISLKKVSKHLSKKMIFNKIIAINKFYLEKLKIKPKIGVIGLNPHNDEFKKNSEEKKIILPAIYSLKKKKIKVFGPIPSDTAFIDFRNRNFNVLIGMYHDQVLSPFKALFKFNAINITLGIPILRISPDHGTGKDIIKKNLANPLSLIEAIKFFNKVNA
ncbi:MAG: hypothetical protein CMI79_05100 [Candidatus Pelagibacter sp.]|nr:hypothetical protein [Candidatus Pelagibacter sp.]|tara:strand:- start:15793 stop:16758 length:966 start_codon:yes stop_codon:yes gene_type:complete